MFHEVKKEKLYSIFSKYNFENDEKILWQGKPSWLSQWVMAFGIVVSIAIALFGDTNEVSPIFWYGVAIIFALLIFSRRRQYYLLTNKRFIKVNAWGFARFSDLNLKNLRRVEIRQGYCSKLVNTAHLFLLSSLNNESGLDLYGQPLGQGIVKLIIQAAQEQGAKIEENA